MVRHVLKGLHSQAFTEIKNVSKSVGISQFRELGLVNEHNMYEFVKNADARCGSHVHAWLQDHSCDEVRCRLVAIQLDISDRLDVTQSTPPFLVARFLLAIDSKHVDDKGDHDWVVGFSVAIFHANMEELVFVHPPRGTCRLGCCWNLNRTLNGTRARSLLVKDTLVRESATAMEVVPMALMPCVCL